MHETLRISIDAAQLSHLRLLQPQSIFLSSSAFYSDPKVCMKPEKKSEEMMLQYWLKF